jgi:hypothetical protein
MSRRLVLGPFFCGLVIVLMASPGTLAAAESRSLVQFHQLGAPSGLRQYVSGAWGIVGVEVLNSEDQPVDVLAACGFSPDPEMQFARRIIVPPRALRRTWVPVRLPEIPVDRGVISCYGLLIDERSGREVVLRREYEGIQHKNLLRVNHDRPLSGYFSDRTDPAEPDAVEYPYEAAIALRTSRGYQRRVVPIYERDLPPLPEVFDGLGQIILWNDRFASDVAILSPLRSWLNDGGELWIMLDRLPMESVERLLGENFGCHVVDCVELHEVTIRNAEGGSSAAMTEGFEQPVNFVRVLVDGMQVTHTVEGWPAAFQRFVGRGRVVFTTLDARAWIERPRMLRPLWDPTRMSDFWPNQQLEELLLLQRNDPPLCAPESLRAYLFEKIGYRIASRGSVSALLGVFCGALLLASVGLAWRRRLEHLAWIVPGLALMAAVPLAALGLQTQLAVPPTVGQAQYVEVSDGGDQMTASGLLAIYDPKFTGENCGAIRGGVFQPEEAAGSGTTRRMVWTDLDRWRWENLRPTTGLWTAAFHWSDDLSQRFVLQGTFSEEGFSAQWMNSSLELNDAVIALPGQSYLAVRASGSRLVAGPGDVLPRGRYLASGWLSDEQRRRQSALEGILNPDAGRMRHFVRPVLFGWSDPLDVGFEFPSYTQRVGAALWSVPLSIARPSPGTRVVIPSPFIPFRATNLPNGQGASPLYDHRMDEWVPSQRSSALWLRFQVPEVVLPLALERARLTLQITAPDRTIEISRIGGDPARPLSRMNNPIGVMEVTLSGATLPELDADGGLVVGVNVGPVEDKDGSVKAQRWKIERVQLEIAGVVQDGLDR